MEEINRGLFEYAIWRQFENDRRSNSETFQYAGVFYAVVSTCMIDSILWHLSKIIDDHQDSIGMIKFLNYIESNCPGIFSTKSSDVIKHLEEDKQQITLLTSEITKIKGFRDKYLAHIDKTIQGDRQLATNSYPITLGEIKQVFTKCGEILNHYSLEYNRSFNALGPSGNDYRNFKLCVEEGYKSLKSKWTNS